MQAQLFHLEDSPYLPRTRSATVRTAPRDASVRRGERVVALTAVQQLARAGLTFFMMALTAALFAMQIQATLE
jgi:hypothetical protein